MNVSFAIAAVKDLDRRSAGLLPFAEIERIIVQQIVAGANAAGHIVQLAVAARDKQRVRRVEHWPPILCSSTHHAVKVLVPVSYTHLDVYKRQVRIHPQVARAFVGVHVLIGRNADFTPAAQRLAVLYIGNPDTLGLLAAIIAFEINIDSRICLLYTSRCV